MPLTEVRLKLLLQARHWQKYGTFCRVFDDAARQVDPELAGTAPSKAQYHRWLSGDLVGLPYPDHCRVLEAMFPGESVAQLFTPAASNQVAPERDPGPATIETLTDVVRAGMSRADPSTADWVGADPRQHRINLIGPGAPRVERRDAETGLDRISRRLHMLSAVLRLSPAETLRLAGLAGNVVDLVLDISFDVAPDGRVTVSYRHELLNMSPAPVSRIARELWFENTEGPLEITPVSSDAAHRLTIQRVHDTRTLAKFACRLSPALGVGEATTFEYACKGGRFVDDHYWRQSVPRHTRQLTLSLRRRRAGEVVRCTGTEEFPDGSERSADETLFWDSEGLDTVITLTRDYLRPNQAITLRWEFANEPA